MSQISPPVHQDQISKHIIECLTLACQGKYVSVTKRISIPEGFEKFSGTSRPILVDAASLSADLDACSIFVLPILGREASLSYGAAAIHMQSFATAFASAETTPLKWDDIYITHDGDIYCRKGAKKWNLPDEHRLCAWPAKFAKVMAEGFDFKASTPQEIERDRSHFRVLPCDPRILKVNEIYLGLKDPEGAEDSTNHAELYAPALTFLDSMLYHMMIASTSLPIDWIPASIHIDGGYVAGQSETTTRS